MITWVLCAYKNCSICHKFDQTCFHISLYMILCENLVNAPGFTIWWQVEEMSFSSLHYCVVVGWKRIFFFSEGTGNCNWLNQSFPCIVTCTLFCIDNNHDGFVARVCAGGKHCL